MYADDLVVIIPHVKYIKTVTIIIKEWCKENHMTVNPAKSGILRILKKSSKKTRKDL